MILLVQEQLWQEGVPAVVAPFLGLPLFLQLFQCGWLVDAHELLELLGLSHAELPGVSGLGLCPHGEQSL